MTQLPSGVYKAYNRASHTVSKTRQVVMLYDGAIRFMQQAKEAIERKDFETRYRRLSRVSEIVIGLQACLDFDSGGISAKRLYAFYASIDLRVFSVHRTNDIKTCDDVIADLKSMRDAWSVIDNGGLEPAAAQSAISEPEANSTADSASVSA
jgi:flagellar protein FliS